MVSRSIRVKRMEVTRTRLLVMVAALLVVLNLGAFWATSNNNFGGSAYLTVRELGQAGTATARINMPYTTVVVQHRRRGYRRVGTSAVLCGLLCSLD